MPDDLTAAQAEWTRLGEEIARHDQAYHGQDAPLITDAEYDALRAQFAALEARHPALARLDSPARRVGARPAEAFGKVAHRVPMLSLDNVFAAEGFTAFIARARRFLGLGEAAPVTLVGEPKIDGLSISLTYEDGIFVRGATRGGRRGGRGCHGQSAHDRRIAPASAWRRAVADRNPRRSLHDQGRFHGDERGAGRVRRARIRQSAQRRGGQPAPARRQHHRRPSALALRLRNGRGKRGGGRHPFPIPGAPVRLGLRRQSALPRAGGRGRCCVVLRRNRPRALRARLRHRWCRLQDRRSHLSEAPGFRRTRATLGGGMEIPRRTRHDPAAGDPHPGRPHRRPDTRGRAGAGQCRRRDRYPRDPAQRGRDRAARYPRRRYRRAATRWRRHSADRLRRAGTQAGRCRGLRAVIRLPDLRQPRGAPARRGGCGAARAA